MKLSEKFMAIAAQIQTGHSYRAVKRSREAQPEIAS